MRRRTVDNLKQFSTKELTMDASQFEDIVHNALKNLSPDEKAKLKAYAESQLDKEKSEKEQS